MKFFSYDGSRLGNFETHETAEEARQFASAAIDYVVDDGDGYEEGDVESVCWGQIFEAGAITNQRELTEEEQVEHPEWCWYGEPKLLSVDAGGDDTAVALADALLLVMDGAHFYDCIPGKRGHLPSDDCSKVCRTIRAALASAGRLP